MNRNELIKRGKNLTDVHAWCSEQESNILTPLQLVCVTQERVAILHAMEWLRMDSDKHVKLEYELPIHLEEKLVQVLQIIKQTEWEIGDYIFDENSRTYKRKQEYQWMRD